jgi:MoaA/NifB/PqqE/SkfB family radical SAM enzyme
VLIGLHQDGVIDVRFSGGEFTQRPDWEVLLRTAQELNLVSTVNTNGRYDDDKTIDKFVQYGVAQVTLSLDGNREQNDFLRGPGSYDETLKSLRQFKDSGIYVRLNSLLFRNNIAYLNEVADIAEAFCDEIDFYHPRPVGRCTNLTALMLSPKQLANAHTRLAHLAKTHPGVKLNYASLEKKERAIKIRAQLDELGLQSDSSDGFTAINIGHDGSLWPSCYAAMTDPSLYLGNILHSRVVDVWHRSEVLKEFRERICEKETAPDLR